jgi:lipopolysaccharide export system permease protein
LLHRIDRYLIGKFLFNFFWSLLAFWIIFIVIDLVEQLDKFIDKGAPFHSVALYYCYFTPQVLILVGPVAVLLATLFGVGFLSKHNELLAMRAAGVSLWRLSFPFLLMGLCVTALVFAAGESIYPRTETRRQELRYNLLRGAVEPSRMLLQNVFVVGGGGRVYHFRTYNTKQNLGSDVTVQTFSDGRVLQSVEAQRLWWKDTIWTAENGGIRTFSETSDSVVSYETFQMTSFPNWKETPEDVVRKRVNPDQLTYGELARTVVRLRATGEDPTMEETELALKIAFPFINVIVVLIGFPIAVRTKQSGMALNFGLAMLVTFVVRVMYEIFRALGHSGSLRPLLADIAPSLVPHASFVAAWVPNIFCLIVGVFALWQVRK